MSVSEASVKSKKKWFTSKGVTLGVAVIAVLSKLKWLLVVLKLAKFGSLISLAIMLGTYAWIFGWLFAVAIVYLIFVHEMGHLWAAKRKGVKTSKAIFLPFVGAVIGLKETPKSAADEAFLAYGGPLWGLASIVPPMVLYWVTGDAYWSLIVTLGCLLNMFNLIPFTPLDGGRIISVVSPKIWAVGLVILVGYAFISMNPLLFIVVLFGVTSCWRLIRQDHATNKFKTENEVYVQAMHDLSIYDATNPYAVAGSDFAEHLKVTYNNAIDEIEELENKLKKLSRFTIPFFQDKKYLEKLRIKNRILVLDHILDAYPSNYADSPEERSSGLFEGDPEFFAEYEKAQEDHTIIKLQLTSNLFNDWGKINYKYHDAKENYYLSDTVTRFTWLFLYLILVGLFIICLIYGTGQLEESLKLLE
jgi:Zn-dependent protease